MSIITFTTDWTNHTHYAGIVKGKILSLHKNLTLVDIAHNIAPHHTAQAAFILRNCFSYYPKGTVHLIDIKTASATLKPIVIFKEGYYFICQDDGLYSLIFHDAPDEVIDISIFPLTHTSFPAIDIFAPTAVHLAKEKSLQALGPPTSLENESMLLRPTIEKRSITGHIIFIDGYGNAITNITRELFERVGENRQPEILIQSNRHIISKLSSCYNEVDNGDLLALFNVSGLLEIAVNAGNISELLGLSTRSTIMIKFKE